MAAASVQARGGSVFTCTDAQGRHWRSDRLILACMDREQRELGPGGVLRRVIAPSMTPEQRALAQEQTRLLAQNLERLRDERLRQHALLMRYADEAAHQRARADALRPLQATHAAKLERLQELQQQRRTLLAQRDAAQVPAGAAAGAGDAALPAASDARLQQRVLEFERLIAVQESLVRAQQQELERQNQRYDEELRLLLRLWSERDGTAAPQRNP